MKPGFVALMAITFAAPVNAQTDAERIRELEARVTAQDALIQSLAGRLDALTRPVASAGAPVETASTVAQARTASAVPPQPQGVSRLSEITTSDGVTGDTP